MAEFFIRAWAEQTLFDCKDYRVEAETLEDALNLLADMIDKAEADDNPLEQPGITARERYQQDTVDPLDPEEIVDGCTGYTLINEDGERVRDLRGVPTGCVQLGEPLEDEAA